MLTMQDIKSHYRFNGDDSAALLELQPLAKAHQEELIDQFYDYLLGIPETAAFLGGEAALKQIRQKHADWFLNLFNGTYDNLYMRNLQLTGHAHVRIGLKAHYVNSAMHLVRRYLVNLIEEKYAHQPQIERQRLHEAVEKILDINLDVMTAAYQEESLKKVFLSKRFEAKLIHATERFTFGLNLILILALVGLSLSVVGLFVWEITHVFSGAVEKGIMSALGTLLILWMMIELLDNEIKTLRGGHFNILVFIGVVIVAIIREILISTLRHDPLTTQAFLAGTLLILGMVYFLVAKSQQAIAPRPPHG